MGFGWRNNNRGIALLMTLAFITIAVSVALEVNRQTRLDIEGTAAIENRLIAAQMASAGVHGAMAILIQDRYASETDHLKETWADPEKLAEALRTVAFEEGHLEVRISDEMARIQINALVDFPQNRQFNPPQRLILERLIDALQNRIEEPSDFNGTDVVNAIKDWLDTGDDDAITGLNGAEEDYYQSLNPPYRPHNGPMAHIAELALIKGVRPILYSGNDNTPGLEALLTVYGATKGANGKIAFTGQVNLNTAPLPVLEALLPRESSDLARALVDYRDMAETKLLETRDWYQDVPGAAGLEWNADTITLSTNIFRIQATAFKDGIQREISAVVERQLAADGQGWTCRVLAWQMS
jgi:general secretion pathway protein K